MKPIYNKGYCCYAGILPLVYDESLSYYEMLCKLTGKMNDVIEVINGSIPPVLEEYISEKIQDIYADITYVPETLSLRFELKDGE